MKLNSLLSVKEDAAVQQEHALLSLLKHAGKEVEKELDYNFYDGEMDYPISLFVTGKSTLFHDNGRCMAETSEILDHVEKEKVVLLVAGYDNNWEEAYVVPDRAELIVKKSVNDGKYVISFRGSKFELTRDEAEKVFADFVDSELFKYKRIGDRKERNWDDDFDEDTPRSVYRAAKNRWMNRDPYDDPDLSEDDYNFEDETMYGALIYKDLHHH